MVSCISCSLTQIRFVEYAANIWAVCGIEAQALANEILDPAQPISAILLTGGTLFAYLCDVRDDRLVRKAHFSRVGDGVLAQYGFLRHTVAKGSFACEQLEQHDACRPNVDLQEYDALSDVVSGHPYNTATLSTLDDIIALPPIWKHSGGRYLNHRGGT